MQAKTFVGKLAVRIGEQVNDVTVLVVANSLKAAENTLKRDAKEYYGSTSAFTDGGYYSHGGDVCTSPRRVNEIGLATFLELRKFIRVTCATNCVIPNEFEPNSSLQDYARSLTKAFNKGCKTVLYAQVLTAMSEAFGEKSWRHFKVKTEAILKANQSAFKENQHSLQGLRRAVADKLFEEASIGKVEAANGWEVSGDVWSQVYFVDIGEEHTQREVFHVEFHPYLATYVR